MSLAHADVQHLAADLQACRPQLFEKAKQKMERQRAAAAENRHRESQSPPPNNKPPQPPNNKNSQYIIVYHIWGVFIIRGVGGLLLGGGDYCQCHPCGAYPLKRVRSDDVAGLGTCGIR